MVVHVWCIHAGYTVLSDERPCQGTIFDIQGTDTWDIVGKSKPPLELGSAQACEDMCSDDTSCNGYSTISTGPSAVSCYLIKDYPVTVASQLVFSGQGLTCSVKKGTPYVCCVACVYEILCLLHNAATHGHHYLREHQ